MSIDARAERSKHPAPTSPERLQRIKVVSDIAIAWLSFLGLVTAGIFALIQFLDAKTKQAVEQSFRLHSQNWSSPLFEQQLATRKAWFLLAPSVLAVLSDPKKSDDQAQREYDELIAKAISSDPQLQTSIDTLVDYYEAVATCVTNGLCDSASTKS